MKPISVVQIDPPPVSQCVQRRADFCPANQRKTRYDLPAKLESGSPIGYRTRIGLTVAEAEEIMPLLSMSRPTGFEPPQPLVDAELFKESALGILSSRQSTNFRGFRQVTFGPHDSAKIQQRLNSLHGREADALDHAAYTHMVLGRPYRNPFTMLLTLVGHHWSSSLLTVGQRLFKKWIQFKDDIPTIGYLPHLHVGILAEAMERATVIASLGQRRAQAMMAPFCGRHAQRNQKTIKELEKLCGLTRKERMQGWQLCISTQVGQARPEEIIHLSETTATKLGANLLAFRSERVQPGVNQDETAPPEYQSRQDMDVPDELVVMAGRCAYNAFTYWTGIDREQAKSSVLLERIDVMTDAGKARLRSIRGANGAITDRVIREMPIWADLPTGRAFSRNAERARKAFALVGQRVYVGGLSRREMETLDIDWLSAVRAIGAVAARSSLYCELMGVTALPENCDLLAGVCLMAGPVNQNDIGKTYYGMPDLLGHNFGDRHPTSLLVWTFKAKTVADPIGNEEQLLSKRQQGALVDLRPAPHEVIRIAQGKHRVQFRCLGDQTSTERAYFEADNFVTAPDGRDIPGNLGEPWPSQGTEIWPDQR
ncbi:MAG: hypothetical protein VX589_21640 [Myxococcota bacterium]|nr:hypothetical protein [Myxococcota bacterium]